MKAKLFHEGDKSQAICSRRGGLVDTTLVRRGVPFSDGKGFSVVR